MHAPKEYTLHGVVMHIIAHETGWDAYYNTVRLNEVGLIIMC
jgi:hypothetical protein